MKYLQSALILAATIALASFNLNAAKKPTTVSLSKEVLKDKIKGGWAGQVIGCTYGGPTEFKYAGIIPSELDIPWDENRAQWYFDNVPGLYDDVYMDLTFVEVFDEKGLDAPIEDFANAFAHAEYPLWHANKAGRYNILQGVMPPASGHWENNVHADDIDFQIEADYAGLMAPGMVNTATYYADGIGHMMNYGDGWYGGVYVAAMYSLAFVSNDVNYVVEEALKVIPEQSKYHKCMADVIRYHKKYPDNWEITWGLINKAYNFDKACPDGVYSDFDIDATINSAYILIGLLYGEGNYYKTLDISTRCGQDSDCNPASAGGILGTILGYSGIPDYWRKTADKVIDRTFPYTHSSVNQATDKSFRQALAVIEKNGGTVSDDKVIITIQKPATVRFEESFSGHYPLKTLWINKKVNEAKVRFDGKGIIVTYHYDRHPNYSRDYCGEVEVYLDGKLDKLMKLPVDMGGTNEIFWKFNLPETSHEVSFKWLNPSGGLDIVIDKVIPFVSELPKTQHPDR